MLLFKVYREVFSTRKVVGGKKTLLIKKIKDFCAQLKHHLGSVLQKWAKSISRYLFVKKAPCDIIYPGTDGTASHFPAALIPAEVPSKPRWTLYTLLSPHSSFLRFVHQVCWERDVPETKSESRSWALQRAEGERVHIHQHHLHFLELCCCVHT